MAASAPPPVVLALGNEDLLVERVVADMMERVRRIDPQAERRDVDAATASASGAFAEAASPSLFGEAAVVVVDNLDSAEESIVDALLAAAAGEYDGCWFVAIHPNGAKGKKILDRLKGVPQVPCVAPKRGRELTSWVTEEFRGNGRRVSSDAVEALTGAIGNDLRALAGACHQLAADVETDPIDEADVRRYFGGVAEISGFQIADAVLARRAVDGLIKLRWAAVGDERKVGPATVAAVAVGLRSLVRFSGAARGGSDVEIAREAGVPVWKVRILRDQLAKWRPEQLARAVAVLADADAATKGGLREGEQLTPAQKDLALERAVLAIARGVPVEE